MATLTKEKQISIDKTIDQIKLDTGLSYPKNSLLEFTKKLGVNVLSGKLPDFNGQKVKGLIKWSNDTDDGGPVIYLHSDQSETTRAFTLAHELGHFILHKNSDQFRIDLFDYVTEQEPKESEANYFAASLLMPEEELNKLLNLTTNLDKIAKYFGVSAPAVETRLKWMRQNS